MSSSWDELADRRVAQVSAALKQLETRLAEAVEAWATAGGSRAASRRARSAEMAELKREAAASWRRAREQFPEEVAEYEAWRREAAARRWRR